MYPKTKNTFMIIQKYIFFNLSVIQLTDNNISNALEVRYFKCLKYLVNSL